MVTSCMNKCAHYYVVIFHFKEERCRGRRKGRKNYPVIHLNTQLWFYHFKQLSTQSLKEWVEREMRKNLDFKNYICSRYKHKNYSFFNFFYFIQYFRHFVKWKNFSFPRHFLFGPASKQRTTTPLSVSNKTFFVLLLSILQIALLLMKKALHRTYICLDVHFVVEKKEGLFWQST